MTPPFLVFLATMICCAFVAFHSFWRLLLRETSPSAIHGGMCFGTAFAGWLLLTETNPSSVAPDGRAIALLLFAALSVVVVHRFELKQSERINPATGERCVPYDGAFSRFGGRWAPQKRRPAARKREPL